jgi:hypothetical protein
LLLLKALMLVRQAMPQDDNERQGMTDFQGAFHPELHPENL